MTGRNIRDVRDGERDPIVDERKVENDYLYYESKMLLSNLSYAVWFDRKLKMFFVQSSVSSGGHVAEVYYFQLINITRFHVDNNYLFGLYVISRSAFTLTTETLNMFVAISCCFFLLPATAVWKCHLTYVIFQVKVTNFQRRRDINSTNLFFRQKFQKKTEIELNYFHSIFLEYISTNSRIWADVYPR